MVRRLFAWCTFVLLPLVLCVITVLVSHLILDSWWVELLGFAMPLVIVTALVLIPIAMRWGRGIAQRLPVLLLLMVLVKPMRETLAITGAPPSGTADLSVMSFNVALFNPYRPYTLRSDSTLYDAFYAYLRREPPPDVLCIQEFYHGVHGDAEQAVDSILHLGGYGSFYMNPRFNKDYDGVIGVATFSRFPMVASGRIQFPDDGAHLGHWVDLLVNGDTLRVVNFHFRSMGIRWQRQEGPRWHELVHNLRHFHDRLRWGYDRRTEELATLEPYLIARPHRTILCTDINALPYSDTYQRLKRLFDNAFERRGRGFGFTYHHFPWFIRIDNQFFSPALEVTAFSTRSDIRISDHYPVEAWYRLPRKVLLQGVSDD